MAVPVGIAVAVAVAVTVAVGVVVAVAFIYFVLLSAQVKKTSGLQYARFFLQKKSLVGRIVLQIVLNNFSVRLC